MVKDFNSFDTVNESVNEAVENMDFTSFVSRLLASQTQAHIFHLQTDSFAAHKALQKYYEGIDGLTDSLVESYQGKYGLIKNYLTVPVIEYMSTDQVVLYFTDLRTSVENSRTNLTDDSSIQNLIDEVLTLINSTLYLLRFLK